MAGKTWSEEELTYIKKNFEKVSSEEMASHLNRTQRSIWHKFHQLNLQKREYKVGDTVNGRTILAVREEFKYGQNKTYVKAKCECGYESDFLLTVLVKGDSERCRRCAAQIRNPLRGRLREVKKHQSFKRLYSIYQGIRNRCYNEKQINYPNYGGRGIKMCEDWRADFINFFNWSITNGYMDGLSIDRTNNDGNYGPDNCAWQNKKYQTSKRRNSINIIAFGETKTADEWSLDLRCKCSYGALCYRIVNGWNNEEAISKPSKNIDNFRRYKALYYFVQKHHPNILQDFTNKQGLGV